MSTTHPIPLFATKYYPHHSTTAPRAVERVIPPPRLGLPSPLRVAAGSVSADSLAKTSLAGRFSTAYPGPSPPSRPLDPAPPVPQPQFIPTQPQSPDAKYTPPAMPFPKPSRNRSVFDFGAVSFPRARFQSRTPPPPQTRFLPPPMGPLHRNTSPPAIRFLNPSRNRSTFDFGPIPFPRVRFPIANPPPPQTHFLPPQMGPLNQNISLPRYSFRKTEPQPFEFRFWPHPLPSRAFLIPEPPTTSNTLSPTPNGSPPSKYQHPHYVFPKTEPQPLGFRFWPHSLPSRAFFNCEPPTTSDTLSPTPNGSPPSKYKPPAIVFPKPSRNSSNFIFHYIPLSYLCFSIVHPPPPPNSFPFIYMNHLLCASVCYVLARSKWLWSITSLHRVVGCFFF